MAGGTTAMLYPALALVALTFVVAARMYLARVGEMKRRRVHPEQLATRAEAAERLTDTRAADHYANLFEIPTLFYPAVLLVWLLGVTDTAYLVLAWAFVAARALHAAIHLTVNRVMWRFLAFVTGLGLLAVLWLRLGVQMLAAA